ncbi:hypothetical protein ABIE09_002497 [Lysobacter enzymogenes]|uniref:M66 family metalloprotease n=1 Tax=Lysobacter enzymogenes TaxID=69 RepID=UPI003393B461
MSSPALRLLAATTVACALTGCPDDPSGNTDPRPAAAIAGAAPRALAASGPNSAALSPAPIGFYDRLADGSERPLRNDLSGAFQGMVQFVQSHSIDPSGNAEKNMPSLVSEREALLLITPTTAFADVGSLSVVATLDGRRLSLPLAAPEHLPRADNPAPDGPDVVYSLRAWSAVLPWDWVKPGLSLEVADERGRQGVLAASAIDFGAPAELIVHNIRVGMLTDPPQSQDHYMLSQPERASADYFQTIPAAQLTVTAYEDLKLPRVMIADGTVYDTRSTSDGDDYSGDMRADVAKDTVSVGINLANWGIFSSALGSQTQPQITQTVVAHHAAGRYNNGVRPHGLSGGNGMLTLYASRGNEFSHEIGHHFGLGHYPGAELEPKDFWSRHHADSGWGYIAHRKRMRANFAWHWPYSAETATASNSFAGRYFYNRDAMSGAEPVSDLSRYSHYTGYSTFLRIQPSLDRIMFDPASGGRKRWNPTARKREATALPLISQLPSRGDLWFQPGQTLLSRARKSGVPIFTVLGGYDPDKGTAVLYPAARGNWGNVFITVPPRSNATSKQCWLQVSYRSLPDQRIEVAPTRIAPGSVNKLHVQIAQDEAPLAASLRCQAPGEEARQLAEISFPQDLAPMAAAVVVGRDKGYQALKNVELAELQTDLLALSGKNTAWPEPHTRLLLDSYSGDIAALSAEAQAQYRRIERFESDAAQLGQWIEENRARLDGSQPAAWRELDDLIERKLALQTPGWKLPAGKLLLFNDACLKVESVAGVARAYFAEKASCTVAKDAWILDGSGRLRPRSQPHLCVSDAGDSTLRLAACDPRYPHQSWSTTAFAQRMSRNANCLSLLYGFLTQGRGELSAWRCDQVTSQGWQLPTTSDAPLLLATRAEHWPYIERWSRNN